MRYNSMVPELSSWAFMLPLHDPDMLCIYYTIMYLAIDMLSTKEVHNFLGLNFSTLSRESCVGARV